MKSRRIAVAKTEKFDAEDGSLFFASSHSSVMPLKVAQNSSSDYSDENYNYPYNSNVRLRPAVSIIILVSVAVFFFTGIFSILIKRCTRTRRASRRARAINNAQGRNSKEATRGLDQTVIESFPIFTYNLVKGLNAQAKETECAVCLTDFQDDEMLRLLPKCSHAFHQECIDMWLCSRTTCPLCRTSLLPADESNPTGTDFGVVEAVAQAQTEQVTVVIDDGGGVSRHGSVRKDVANDGAQEAGRDSSIIEKFKRSHSTGHSLVRVRKELEQQPTEWYIETVEGLTPGLHRSCSFVALHHSRSQGACSSKVFPASNKAGGSFQEACRDKSERWGEVSMNPAAISRSISLRRPPQPRDQRPAVPQQDFRAYLKKSFSLLTGRNRTDCSASSVHADQSEAVAASAIA